MLQMNTPMNTCDSQGKKKLLGQAACCQLLSSLSFESTF